MPADGQLKVSTGIVYLYTFMLSECKSKLNVMLTAVLKKSSTTLTESVNKIVGCPLALL